MTRPNSAALIIGVSDYSRFDASAGQPVGTSDLLGPRHDVAAVWTLLRQLNVPAPNIVVLTDTQPAAEPDARPRRIGRPTRQAILEGVAEVARLVAGGGASQGFLYFSGHGAEQGGAVLCSGDTERAEDHLHGVVAVSEIRDILAEVAPDSSFTAIFECCHAGGAPSARGLGRGKGALPELREQDVVLAACAADQSAQEAVFGGTWHGAFTWATLRVLEQYARRPVGGFVTKDIAGASVARRARRILHSLGFRQTPQSSGAAAQVIGQPAGVAGVSPRLTRRDGSSHAEEIWAGDDNFSTFRLEATDGSLLGYLVSTREVYSNWKKDKDYWKWNGTAWPSVFQIVWDENADPPDEMFGSSPTGFEEHPLLQFASTSSSFDLSGQTVWGLSATGMNGYLARNGSTGKLGWFSTGRVATGEDPPLAVWMLTASSVLAANTSSGSTTFTAYPGEEV